MIHRNVSNMDRFYVPWVSILVVFVWFQISSRTLSRRLLTIFYIFVEIFPGGQARVPREFSDMPNTIQSLLTNYYVLYATKSTMDGMVDDGPVD